MAAGTEPTPRMVPAAAGGRFDLLRLPLAKRVATHRAFQFALTLPALFVFTLVILTGLFGTAVGNANFSTIFVWVVWWALLIVVFIPVGGRAWCTMCPIPSVGEWVQRRAVVAASSARPFSLGRNWPKPFRNIWMQNVSFLAVAGFSGVILTRPLWTGALLLGFVVLALALFLIYRRRAFCRFVCPVSGFIGLYSGVAPVELRSKDPDVCLRHCGPRGKECLKGSSRGYGCPWYEYPGALDRNAYCGLCTECLKNCPLDNIAVNLRPFGADLLVPKRSLDEAFKAFIMLATAGIYSATMLGPWGWLKAWANLGSGNPLHFIGFVALVVGSSLVLAPSLLWAACWAARTMGGARHVPVGRLFTSFAYATIPLGLAAWIAFTIGFVFTNMSYALPVVSDPFGWGWNLFGTRDSSWTPYLPWLVPYVQVPVLAVGLALSIVFGHRIAVESLGNARRVRWSLLPIASLLAAMALTLLWLYLG